MKYYQLYHTLNLKVIGAFPQIQTFIEGYDSERLESCSQIGRFYCSQTPNKPLDFDGLELAKSAKLTDYAIAAYLSDLCGLLISHRLFEFFSRLSIVDYIGYETKIYQKKSTDVYAVYKWIHYSKAYPEMIDYKESHFYEDHHNPTFKKLAIRSYEEYTSVCEKVEYTIKPARLVLKNDAVKQYDVLRIGVIKGETYITEAVKREMEDIGFTGIEYKPADYLFVG